jgi:predicted nucleotidyltransferase
MVTTDDILASRAARRLRGYRRAIEKALPGRVDRMLLVGSRARGDARRASDYDVVVFVKDMTESERQGIRWLLAETSLPHVAAGYDIVGLALPTDCLRASADHQPSFVRNVLRDGIPVA